MRTVLITGASAGIGEALALYLAKEGKYRLLLCARRKERLLQLSNNIRAEHSACEVFTFELDVCRRQDVEVKIGELPSSWKKIDILINNAGLSQGLEPIQHGLLDDWDRMIDTNLKGLLYVTRSILPLMRSSESPQIVNIGSIAGKEVYPNGNVYCATKHAVDALNKAMRIDLVKEGVKVTAIHPGMVETEFSEVRFRGDKERAGKVYKDFQPLVAKDIAHIISFVLSLPRHVNINDLLVMPLAQANPYVVNKTNI